MDRGARQRLVTVLLISLISGCSAIHQPYAKTIEHKLEVLSRIPKSEERALDLRLLGQTPPPEHLVSDGDILGIYIEGNNDVSVSEMPVRFPDDRNVAPAIGYPTPVRNGGVIRVPHVGVIHVSGLTVWQIEEKIRQMLTTGPTAPMQPDKTQIHVSLMWKRAVNVMVVRQEEVSPTRLLAPSTGTDPDRRSGQVVELPAFRNDVLNALLETGGLPNDQAENAVYIFKRRDRQLAGQHGLAPNDPRNAQGLFPMQQSSTYQHFAAGGVQQVNFESSNLQFSSSVQPMMEQKPQQARLPPLLRGGHTEPLLFADSQQPPFVESACQTCTPDSRHPNAIRIPLSLAEGEVLPFSQNDVLLEDGDIVLVESREDEHFFTAGLLGGRQFSLPRNQDLDVIDAVLLADSYSRQTQLNAPTRSIGGVSVLNRDVTVGASRVVIERKTADGQTDRFRVNLYKAMRNPDQRIMIEPGDRLYLEYTAAEAFMAFFERHLLDPFTAGVPTLVN